MHRGIGRHSSAFAGQHPLALRPSGRCLKRFYLVLFCNIFDQFFNRFFAFEMPFMANGCLSCPPLSHSLVSLSWPALTRRKVDRIENFNKKSHGFHNENFIALVTDDEPTRPFSFACRLALRTGNRRSFVYPGFLSNENNFFHLNFYN